MVCRFMFKLTFRSIRLVVVTSLERPLVAGGHMNTDVVRLEKVGLILW